MKLTQNFTLNAYIFFIIFILCANFSKAQNKIAGQVVDINTQKPIPFSTIEVPAHKTGTIADSCGKFQLKLKPESKKMEIIVSSIGYKTRKIKITSENDELKVKLQKKTYKLDEISVTPKEYTLQKLGIDTRRAPYELFGVIGVQHGIFIKNPTKKPGYIKTVSVYIKKHGFPQCPFRIRVYKMNKKQNAPTEDLLHENVIVESTKKGGRWNTFDLSSYNIPFPPDGAFIAVQWINQGDEYHFPVNFGKHKAKEKYAIRYGSILGFSKPDYEPLSWYKYLGNPWKHFKGKSQPMIKVEAWIPVEN